jgi:hypothetical protein
MIGSNCKSEAVMSLRKQEIQRIINFIHKKANEEISGLARGGGMYAAGLASEGYVGGYRDALSHVMLLLNGVWPNNDGYGWWSSAQSIALQAGLEDERRRKRKTS